MKSTNELETIVVNWMYDSVIERQMIREKLLSKIEEINHKANDIVIQTEDRTTDDIECIDTFMIKCWCQRIIDMIEEIEEGIKEI